jgi:hypothetical protein
MVDKNKDLEKIIIESEPKKTVSTQKYSAGKFFLDTLWDVLKGYGRHIARVASFNFSGNVRNDLNEAFSHFKLDKLGPAYYESLAINYALVVAGIGVALYSTMNQYIEPFMFQNFDLHTLKSIYLNNINLVSSAASGAVGLIFGGIEFRQRIAYKKKDENTNKALSSLAGKILSLPYDAFCHIYDWLDNMAEKYNQRKEKYENKNKYLQLKLFN